MKRQKWFISLLFIVMPLFLTMAIPAFSQNISGVDTARRLYNARAGDPQEQYLLGLMYEYGKGIAQNNTEAAHWYMEAAKQGHIRGQLSLGNLYDKGKGVEQSYKEALQWYLKAAQQGSPEAMYFIGSMTYNGDGTRADPRVAMQWFRKSAENGLKQGQVAYEEIRAQIGDGPKTVPKTVPATVSTTAARSKGAVKTVTSPQAPVPPPVPVVAAGARQQDASNTIRKGYAVQIGSFKTRQQAEALWARLQSRKPEDFGGAKAYIYKKIFESGKVFYRLNAAVFPQKSDANAQCAQYKAKGTDCIIVKY